MLSTPGIGSGLDIAGIIDQLMAIEKRPLVRLGTTQVELEAQLSGFGKLKSTVAQFQSAMETLADPANFRQYKATSSDTKVLAASADSTAARGSYAIEVVRTAENHRLAAATALPSGTAVVGLPGDTMTITVGSTAFVVDIGDKSLADVRDAINAAGDEAGITASILHDDSGYRLSLAADATGSSSFISVAYSGADPFALQSLNLDRDGNAAFDAADLDAVLMLENSFTITRSGNTVTDVIEGVTLNLLAAGTATLDVTRDNAKIAGSVQQFIAQYNGIVKLLDELRGGVLSEERSSLLSLAAQFRSIINTRGGSGGTFSFLSEIGVTTQRDGTLALDTTVLDGALGQDPTAVADLFAGDDSGLAVRFTDFARSLVGVNGLFDNREQSLNARIRSTETARANLEFRLVQKEAALVQQFSALDALIAQLTTTSNFLTSQLGQIAANTNSSRNG
jgi:flagellar hook-associated protein 2